MSATDRDPVPRLVDMASGNFEAVIDNIAVYRVLDGRIARVEFFLDPQPGRAAAGP